ncbi:MAG: cytochrome c oxidase subunit II [Saprospiraceae bacterium]|nr:cytochrome c oxidase subunit II [Saprospiraceae bacterium]
MGFTIGAICAILFTVFIVQVAKARELASIVRNDSAEQDEINKFQAGLGLVFLVSFMAICVWSFVHYIPTSMGWGPNIAASEHGPDVDYLFNLTLFFIFIVFVLTHIALFWFPWKFRGVQGKVGLYWAHNELLEIVWMVVPAVVMTFLVIGGLQAWNNIMLDFPEDEGYTSVAFPNEDSEKEFIEIEATGSQFLWYLRYPGRDGKLGTKYFTQINSNNQLGQTWTDEKNMDDFLVNEIVLPVNKPVRVRITARDVLHNFYIRDMRVKMDAVPGMPTYFIFTPTVTTDSMRRRLSNEPEWQVPDKNDDSKQRWETYKYELACAELCGKGHYSMKNIVTIVEEDEYLDWFDKQEGGKLNESVDSVTGNKTYVFEKGSVKSKYFSYFNTVTDEFNPLQEKTEPLEKIVENKLRVGLCMKSMKDWRNSSEEGTDDYVQAEEAMAKLKPLLKSARLYTVDQVDESYDNVKKSLLIVEAAMAQIQNTDSSDATLTIEKESEVENNEEVGK